QLNEEDRGELVAILNEVIESVHGMSSIKLDLTSLVDYIKSAEEEEVVEVEAAHLNPKRLASFVLSPNTPRLNIIYLPEPDTARLVVSRFIDRLLLLKKTSGVRRKVLVVLDEAQEFIPDRTIRSDFTDNSNRAVEALLRQGRKYRAHCWISTQRVAHLNVNALQQLHSYFVSTLPRFYDRMVIADSFSLSYDVLDKTTELDTGEWLFVSYKATKQKNVPVFIKAPDNEELLTAGISRME
ncbi:MAG: ATP-binding protein, partial [archaeon]|nr:ATP-binding protein [archaeon]